MLNAIVKGIAKIFGNKSDRDLKEILPLVEEINQKYAQLNKISNDELRAKTIDLRKRIQDYIADIKSEIDELKARVENEADMDIQLKEEIFKEIDLKEKEKNKKLEEVLNEILPEAFAIVKETAKRFTENSELVATATEFDRNLATKKTNLKVVANDVIYSNTWKAAGNDVTWNMIHYDVQLIGGIVLHRGKIAEMATGEGKTLVSTLPAFLNALTGEGVHLVTVNDYLARRDCEWNAPIFEFHGISVDCIDYYQPNSPERRNAYKADITYGTNNEFGFDYLRDNMAHDINDLVQRKHHYAMVDEVDSVLIDDARTPLIISGPVARGDQQEFIALKPRIEKLVDAQKRFVNQALNEAKRLIEAGDDKNGGLALLRAYRGLPKSKALIKFLGEKGIRAVLTKTENYYLQDQQKEMHKVDAELYFVIDEKNNSIDLTEKGLELITMGGEEPNFFVLPDVGSQVAEIEKMGLDDQSKKQKKDELMREYSIKAERIHSISQLLKAYTLFEKDVEYIIADGKVKIVDEQTGRIMEGRRYSDGLHQAIEAKENVKVEAATQTFATVTLQNFFRMYHKLAGMTGTAETEAGEFWEIYKLDVVVIPTHRPIVRKDSDDLVYKTKREKYTAVIDEIVKLTSQGRPVLVGTTSVEVSELLSKMLKFKNIKHNVLNAKQHQREAEIVAEAGIAGAVTIATNMAGRGTDIKLGPGVKDSGGLAIIGTERHESRRVDRQLRGRSGRQGDPGSTQFFISLEDDLMRLFGSERVAGVMDRFGHKEGEVIQHSLITRSVENSQKKVEQNNFGIRKRLLEYDDVMNNQRNVIYSKRKNALFGDRLALDISNMIGDYADEVCEAFHPVLDYDGFKLELIRALGYDPEISKDDFIGKKREDLADWLFNDLIQYYNAKSNTIAQQALPVIQQIYNERGSQIQNIGVPFTDGIRGLNVVVNLKKAYETQGREVIKSFEKVVVLALIDEEWKEHLREMDDLRQAVQNATYEQKDPLLIYKKESFDLFRQMLSRLGSDVLGMLFRGGIAVQQNEGQIQEAREMPRPVEKVQANKPELSAAGGSAEPKMDKQPLRAELKVGRNEPCPCGSGKKFKSCHGAGLV